MDEIVEAALRKWPNVPHCYGWLGLDARGDWYLRDEAAQAAGAFPAVKGSRIEHPGLRAFIERNYASDDAGAWFFQNGPQRVYVELEAAPYVWRLVDTRGAAANDGAAVDPSRVVSHTGRAAQVASCWVDEAGRLFLDTDIGVGVVHTLDMHAAADVVERGAWLPEECRLAELAQRFGYRLRPGSEGAAGS
ncbi:DUF2946 family protein [Piscinibacter koreensis]|uniref:DUF2946 family protein n=1 Tax=Piscinibacter koreensis TaxID=2742824 RepID=A0A7Y6NJG5_9BURK|nr:DUF2946 family protein [Schlegelella koreensis]